MEVCHMVIRVGIVGMKFDGSLLTSHILKCGSALSTSSHTSPPTK